jgi:hypothetical protein
MDEQRREGLKRRLDKLLTDFTSGKDTEVLHQIIPILGVLNVLVPAAVPANLNKGMLEDLKNGAKMEMPKGMKPMPALLQTKKGGRFLGIYTEKKHVRTEKGYPLLLDMHFVDCCTMAKKLDLDGIVVNAFTQNLTFKKPAIDAFIQDYGSRRKKETKTIRLTREQMEDVTRKNIELRLLPQFIFEGGAKYIDDLCEGKEELLAQIYAEPYKKVPEMVSPYKAEDFSLMDLNIAEDMMLVRLDMPEKKLLEGSCVRIYITVNPQTEDIHYFTIQKSKPKEKNLLGKVRKDGKHEVIGEAPEEGGEIERVMELVRSEQKDSE